MPDACGLCPALAPLAPKSHVIPQWMYDLLPQDKHRFRIASSHLGEFEQRSQSGVYGRFVCQACEDRFAAWDDYAAIVLRRTPKLRNGGSRNTRASGRVSTAAQLSFTRSRLWSNCLR